MKKIIAIAALAVMVAACGGPKPASEAPAEPVKLGIQKS